MKEKILTPDEAVDATRQAYRLLSMVLSSNHPAFRTSMPCCTQSKFRKNVIYAKNLLDISLNLVKA